MTYHIALKVDVDTLRGTLEGTPALLDLFGQLGISATVLFSLGPDHTGRAMKRVFRPGFFGQGATHFGGRALRHQDLAVRHALARTRHWSARPARDATGARRGP